MRRVVASAWNALLLALAVCAVVLWVRGQWRYDEIQLARTPADERYDSTTFFISGPRGIGVAYLRYTNRYYYPQPRRPSYRTTTYRQSNVGDGRRAATGPLNTRMYRLDTCKYTIQMDRRSPIDFAGLSLPVSYWAMRGGGSASPCPRRALRGRRRRRSLASIEFF